MEKEIEAIKELFNYLVEHSTDVYATGLLAISLSEHLPEDKIIKAINKAKKRNLNDNKTK